MGFQKIQLNGICNRVHQYYFCKTKVNKLLFYAIPTAFSLYLTQLKLCFSFINYTVKGLS